MRTLISVIGARPQFIKAAPIELAMAAYPDIRFLSVHTGQHYDDNMSRIFFDQLGLKQPIANLQAGSGSHATQTAQMLPGLEALFLEHKPDMVLVYGDTNSTLAAALTAAKMCIPVAHVEAGLRSFNRTMPEEVNRVLTDHISNLLFIPGEVAKENLRREGISDNVHDCGDVMLDILLTSREKALSGAAPEGQWYYATIHRPYNTDDPQRLLQILQIMNRLEHEVYFAIHPRTANLLKQYGASLEDYPRIHFIPPQSYFDNLQYLLGCERVITDSGGLQKEAWFVQKPCITLRPETEWVETLENDWNQLVFHDLEALPAALTKTPGAYRAGVYGDGHAAERMAALIHGYLYPAPASNA